MLPTEQSEPIEATNRISAIFTSIFASIHDCVEIFTHFSFANLHTDDLELILFILTSTECLGIGEHLQ